MADTEDVEHTETIDGSKIRVCPEGQTLDGAIYEQKDSDGNKFEIFCKNGSYEGRFTPKGGGQSVCVGRCKYRLGYNDISKKLLSTFKVGDVLDPNSLVIKKVRLKMIAQKIEKIIWKNIGPVGPPPTTGKQPYGAMGDGEDTLWTYDVKTGQIITQKTKHTGNWVLNHPNDDKTKVANWTWKVSSQESDGEPTQKAAPKDPDELGMRLGEPSGGVAAAERYLLASVAPMTVWDNGKPVTFNMHMPVGSDRFQPEPVEAMVNEPFRLEIRLPNKEERLLRFALLDGPSGMKIDRFRGVITWTPKPDQAGAHKVVLVHRYHELTAHVDQFILPVKPAKRAPRKHNKRRA